MKILHVIRQGKVGGAESNLLELIRNLDSDEFTPVVISFSYGSMVEQLRELGVLCHVIPESRIYNFRNSRAISSIARQERPDIIHVHDRRAASCALFASYRHHIPLMYHPHSWSFHQSVYLLKKAYFKFNERLLVHLADLNIAVSDNQLKEGIQLLGMPRSMVIPHGVDIKKFSPGHHATLSKKCFGIPDDRTVVGFLASLTEKKDPLTFLRAAALSLKEDKKLHFIVAGDGELKEACLAEVKKLNIGNHVSFETYRTNVADLLQLFDIYCLPSQWEGLSIGILEAMAMEKAIIASPVNGNLEVIANGIDGMLATSGTPDHWKEAILKLHYSPQLRHELGQRARMIVECHYNSSLTSGKMAAAYHRLIHGGVPAKVMSKGVLESA